MTEIIPKNDAPPPTIALGTSPLDQIALLLQRNVTPEQLDKFLEVQQKWEREQARRAYVKAMAAFKAEPIAAIKKKKPVKMRLKNKQTGEYSGAELSYKHETLAQVVNAAVSALAKHGLSHSWDVKQEQNRSIAVACVMTHEAGHSERVTLYGMPDESGQKNPLQQMRSTVTYLQRATLLLITGLAAEGDDDDGQAAEVGPISEEQAKTVKRLLQESGSDTNAFLSWLDAKTIEQIPASEFDRACAELNRAVRARKKKASQ